MLPPKYPDELLSQRLGHRQALPTLVTQVPVVSVYGAAPPAVKHCGALERTWAGTTSPIPQLPVTTPHGISASLAGSTLFQEAPVNRAAPF